MNEHSAKLKAIKCFTDCLNDHPLKPEFEAMFWNRDHMAEEILMAVEQVEADFLFAQPVRNDA